MAAPPRVVRRPISRAPALCLLLVLAVPAWAEERAATRPQTTSQVADAIVAAVKAKDEEALRRIADRKGLAPWIVADLLCARDAHDAADAFVKASSQPGLGGLHEYIDSRRGKTDDARARKAVAAAVKAMRSRDLTAAFAAIKDVEGGVDTLIGLSILFHKGLLFRPMRRLQESSELSLRAAAGAERLGWVRMAMRCYDSAGIVHRVLGNWKQAIEYYRRGLAHAETLEDPERIAAFCLYRAYVHHDISQYLDALALYERALPLLEKLGDDRRTAQCLNGLGRVHNSIANFGQALTHYDRAMRLYKKHGDLGGVASIQVNEGVVHDELGNYAKALELYEAAVRNAKQAGRPRWAANATGNMGGVYYALGDYDKAREHAERALEMMQAQGRRGEAAAALIGLGLTATDLGDYDGAKAHLHHALVEARAVQGRALEAHALSALGRLHMALGENDEAQALYEQALTMAREMGDRLRAASIKSALGGLAVRKGKREAGLKLVKQAIRDARRLRARPLLVSNLRRLAGTYLKDGEPSRALYLAAEALREVALMLRGLGEDNATQGRWMHSHLFGIGALAAARLEEPAEAVTFLESGRAGALLEALGGRRALRWTDLSDELRRAQHAAKQAHTAAHAAYRQALAKGDWKGQRAAAKVLDASALRVREVAGRIQREAKGQAAGLFYPTAATLEELQFALDEKQALVLYGLCMEEALALVLTRESESIVRLGTVADVCDVCRGATIDDDSADPSAAIAQLQKTLVTPLALPKDVTQVIVSPEGPLSYVPFGAIFEQAVALTPSGTTHLLLLEHDSVEHGKGVLALGDPTYGGAAEKTIASRFYARGRQLARLPATREEARRVGQEVLLGADATEAGLTAKLKERRRWRAVHFACHGLVDPENASLSALALTAEGEDDGFLTALEVLRMDIPADLAVLSACETGKGDNVRGEGIIGLTRAFMYAGAPRVLCSLWKVDDEATRALMVKFYELWNPKESKHGLGAAKALQQAQAFVRGHEKWKAPHYWAAWVLWGLPD